MVKFYLTNILSLITLSAFGATDWHVSTEPTAKNVLVEEFTGIHCGYCPQAHVITNNMVAARPETVSVIAIHAGSFAVPVMGQEPDFRTEAGNIIHDSYSISGYPCGMVNRLVSWSEDSDPITSRNLWTAMAREEEKGQAPLNIWAKAVYEGSERLLTVEVEGYFVEEPASYSDVKIHIAITQNNILGPQNGTTDGYEYLHQHMLRDYMTDPLGDSVAAVISDRRFKVTYSYEIPENWNDVKADPRELMPVIFVTGGQNGEVLNSKSLIPEYENYEPRASYLLSDFKVPADGNSYGYDFIDLYFRNLSAETVSLLTFDISTPSKGSVTSSLEDVEVLPMHKGHLKVPCEGICSHVDGTLTVRLKEVNGKQVTADPLKLELTEVTSLPSELTVALRTDNYASDNVWTIRDSEGNEVFSFGPFEDGEVTEYKENIVLADGQIYCLEVEDSWGDGVLEPRGLVKLYDSDGNMMAQNMQIQTHGTRIFFLADSSLNPAGIEDLESVITEKGNEYFTMKGISLGSSVPSGFRGIAMDKRGNKYILSH